MASIKKIREHPPLYRARYRDETGKEHAAHRARKADAQTWLDMVTAAVMTGTYVDPKAGRMTFASYFASWVERQVWATGTEESARQAGRSVTFAQVPMKTLRASHVQAWVKAMTQPAKSRKSGLEPSTIRTRFNYVHMALRAAVLDKVIAEDPSANQRLPKVRKRAAAMTIPTPDEVLAATREAQPHFRAFVQVCAFAGLRLGEAAGLQVGDIDFLRRTITVARQVQGQTRAAAKVVPPKYGSERDIPVADDLLLALARHLQETGPWGEEGWVFGSGGDLFNRNSAGNQWRSARAASGLSSDVTLHDLRHFYASGLIAEGCDVATVQRALGHSSPSITLDIYTHLWPKAEDRTRAAAARLWDQVHDESANLADSLRTGGGETASEQGGWSLVSGSW